MPRKSLNDGPSSIRKGAVLARGQRIRELRAQKNWTQEDLAERSGISVSAISDMENGRACFPNKVHCVAIALGTTFSAIAVLPEASESTVITPYLDMPGSAADFLDEAKINELAQERARRIGSKHRIIIIQIHDANSVRITIAIVDDDLGRLVNAYADKKLDPLNVSEIVIPDNEHVERALEPDVQSPWNILRDRSFKLLWTMVRSVFHSHVRASFGETMSHRFIHYLARRDPPTVDVNVEHGEVVLKRLQMPGE